MTARYFGAGEEGPGNVASSQLGWRTGDSIEVPEETACRVGVVDDHAMIRDAIGMALDRTDDLEVVAIAASVGEAREVFGDVEIDVAVVDYGLPDGSGVDFAVELAQREPTVPSIILTASEGVQSAAAALEAGCAGFLRKSVDLDQLVRGIRRVHAGEALFDAQTLSAAISWMHQPAPPAADLTARELEVLEHLAQGSSTLEISRDLFLSHHTVRNHVRNLLAKLGARSQLEAVVMAAQTGLVDVGRGS